MIFVLPLSQCVVWLSNCATFSSLLLLLNDCYWWLLFSLLLKIYTYRLNCKYMVCIFYEDKSWYVYVVYSTATNESEHEHKSFENFAFRWHKQTDRSVLVIVTRPSVAQQKKKQQPTTKLPPLTIVFCLLCGCHSAVINTSPSGENVFIFSFLYHPTAICSVGLVVAWCLWWLPAFTLCVCHTAYSFIRAIDCIYYIDDRFFHFSSLFSSKLSLRIRLIELLENLSTSIASPQAHSCWEGE